MLLRYIAKPHALRDPAAVRDHPGQFFHGEADPGRPGRDDARPDGEPAKSRGVARQDGPKQAVVAAIRVLYRRCPPRQPRLVLADDQTRHRRSASALSRDLGAGHVRPAVGDRDRISAGRRGIAPSIRARTQVCRLLRPACRSHAGLLVGAGAHLHFLHAAGMDRGTPRTHRSWQWCRQRRLPAVLSSTASSPATSTRSLRHSDIWCCRCSRWDHQRRTDSEDDANHGDPRSVFRIRPLCRDVRLAAARCACVKRCGLRSRRS